MPAAGEYDTRFVWTRPTRSGRTNAGEVLTSDEDLGKLWGALENLSANREERLGSTRQVTRATIRIRNNVDVLAGDGLQVVSSDRVWRVETVVAGDDETICDVIVP